MLFTQHSKDCKTKVSGRQCPKKTECVKSKQTAQKTNQIRHQNEGRLIGSHSLCQNTSTSNTSNHHMQKGRVSTRHNTVLLRLRAREDSTDWNVRDEMAGQTSGAIHVYNGRYWRYFTKMQNEKALEHWLQIQKLDETSTPTEQQRDNTLPTGHSVTDRLGVRIYQFHRRRSDRESADITPELLGHLHFIQGLILSVAIPSVHSAQNTNRHGDQRGDGQ